MKEYSYKAFISYRHTELDKKIAQKLQKMLETYKAPKGMRNSKEKWKVFRDETELPSSSDLSEDIKSALANSEYLIVICSKDTAKSRWCLEEITQFKKLHNGTTENIITLLAEGEPDEVFPKELCTTIETRVLPDGSVVREEKWVEPLAANIVSGTQKQTLKKLNNEFLRIVAPLLGCGYDDLFNRNHRRKVRKITFAVVAAFLLMSLFMIYSSIMLMQISEQRNELQAKNEELRLRTEELNTSNSNLESTNKELDKTNKELDETNTKLEDTNTQLDSANISLTETNNKLDSANLALTKSNTDLDSANNALQQTNSKLQQTNTQLDQSNEQLQKANGDLDSANTALTKSNADLAQKTEEANNNYAEANIQRQAAEANLEEATRQREIAEANMDEANKQKEIAEANMQTALENEALANEANRTVRIKNSEILANQSETYYKNDDITSAIQTAIEALPNDNDDDIPQNPLAERVLIESIGAYSSDNKMFRKTVNLSGYVNFLEFAEDGAHILAGDSTGNVYIIDYATAQIIKTYSPNELFDQSQDTSARDICVDKNTGYVLSNGVLVSIDLQSGDLNWRYDSESISFDDIEMNEKTDKILITSYSTYRLIGKDGAVINSASEENNNYKCGIDDKTYMDRGGRVYVTDIKDGKIGVLNSSENNWQWFDLPTEDYDEVLAIGESEECVFLNLRIRSEDILSSYNAELVCFAKNDMSVKWKTKYEGNYLSAYMYNCVFELTHNVPDDNGVFNPRNGVIVISGTNILAFDRQSGEKYFQTATDYDNQVIYCKPNEKNTVQIGGRKVFGTYMLMRYYEGETRYNKDSLLFADRYYTFDEEIEYMAHANESDFAIASRDSSEIKLYQKISFNNSVRLNNMPTETGVFDKFSDNGKGVFAAYKYHYQDVFELNNKERKDYIIIYDVNSDTLLAYKEIDMDVSNMAFVGDKLFVVDDNGKAEIFDYNGNLCEKIDLKQRFRELNNILAKEFLYFERADIFPVGDSILFCTQDGILYINLSNGTDIRSIMYRRERSYDYIYDYSVSNEFITFTTSENAGHKIRYFKLGDNNIPCVQDNNSDFVYEDGKVTSLINSSDGDLIAFLGKEGNEGYIGIYKAGDENISRIVIPRDEAVPSKIKFSPDSKYILAMCANGELIKYSVATLEEVMRLNTELVVASYTDCEFADDSSFFVKDVSKLNIFDFDSMQLKFVVNDSYEYFMKNDKKILCDGYTADGHNFVYYNYLTTDELIERGKKLIADLETGKVN